MSKLWGGRFSKKTNKLVEDFTKSIQYDYKLAKYDVMGSQAHVTILEEAGYLTRLESKKLWNGLEKIYKKIIAGSFKADKKCEDIHTDIQNKLKRKQKQRIKIYSIKIRD